MVTINFFLNVLLSAPGYSISLNFGVPVFSEYYIFTNSYIENEVYIKNCKF